MALRTRSRTRGAIGNDTALSRGRPERFRDYGILVWLRADKGTTIATGVSQWDDLGPSGNNATQGTAGSQPALIASAQNGKQCVRGDGTDDQMTFAGFVIGANITVFMVASLSSAANAYLWSNNDGTLAFISAFGGVSFEWFNAAGDRATFSAGATGTHRLTVGHSDGVSKTLYLDGAIVVGPVVPTVAVTGKTITKILAAGSGASPAGSDVEEFIFYNGLLNASALNRRHNCDKARYGV